MQNLLELLKKGRLPLFNKEARHGYTRMNIAGFCQEHREYVRGVVFKNGSNMDEVARHANSERAKGCPACVTHLTQQEGKE